MPPRFDLRSGVEGEACGCSAAGAAAKASWPGGRVVFAIAAPPLKKKKKVPRRPCGHQLRSKLNGSPSALRSTFRLLFGSGTGAGNPRPAIGGDLSRVSPCLHWIQRLVKRSTTIHCVGSEH